MTYRGTLVPLDSERPKDSFSLCPTALFQLGAKLYDGNDGTNKHYHFTFQYGLIRLFGMFLRTVTIIRQNNNHIA